LACACNGRFYGGGFNPIPDAVPDDEVIDFLVVEPVSRLKVAQVVGQYAKGRFREFPHLIKYERGSYMEIGCDKEFVVNIDGEAIFYKSIRFELLPKSINFIFPAGMDYTTGSSNIPAFANQ
jgi:diacylglycerol kinase family enzyme